MTTLTWLGHGSWLIETGGTKVLLDPFLSDSPTAPVKADAVETEFILVSHGHFDHVADVASIANRCGSTVVSCYEIVTWFGEQHGVEKGEPMNLGGEIALPLRPRQADAPRCTARSFPTAATAAIPAAFC